MNVDKMIKAVAELNLTPALSDAKLNPKLVKLVVLQTAKPRGQSRVQCHCLRL